MAAQIQLKLSTLKRIVENAERIQRNSFKHTNPTIPVVRITKTADLQHGELEDKFETELLVESVQSFEVVEG